MGRKKKKFVKPWCWYCNREFDDDKVLVQHQKAKHFKCHLCHKKLYTGPGLAIHCMQVHKETIERIPNSAPNRGSTEVEIYGMEGIPEADLKAHEAMVLGKSDEPLEKVARLDESSTSSKPAVMPILPGLTGVGTAPFQYPHPGSMVGMPPGAPVIPPLMSGIAGLPGHQVPSSMPSMIRNPFGAAPQSAMVNAGVATGASLHAGPPFQHPTVGAMPPRPSSQVAFPAYEAAVQESPATQMPMPAVKPVMVIASGTMIMHPDEDLSLEEIRLTFPKYAMKGAGGGGRSGNVQVTTPAADAPPATVSGPATSFYPPGHAAYASSAAVPHGQTPPMVPQFIQRNVY